MLFSSSLPLLVTPGVGLAGGSWLHEWDRLNRLHARLRPLQVCTGMSTKPLPSLTASGFCRLRRSNAVEVSCESDTAVR